MSNVPSIENYELARDLVDRWIQDAVISVPKGVDRLRMCAEIAHVLEHRALPPERPEQSCPICRPIVRCSAPHCAEPAFWRDSLDARPTPAGRFWCSIHARVYRSTSSVIPFYQPNLPQDASQPCDRCPGTTHAAIASASPAGEAA